MQKAAEERHMREERLLKGRKQKNTLVFAIMFLICLFLMDYPFLARLYNSKGQEAAVVAYQERVEETPDRTKEELRAAAEEYNKKLASGLGLAGDFLNFDGNSAAEEELEEETRQYLQLLNSGEDGVMGRLEIPKIQVDLLIYHGVSEEVLQKGAGHIEGSALPVGGEDTHSCLSAHRGLVGKKMFTNLDLLEKGDLFFLHVLGDTLCYRVRDVRTILPNETESLAIREGEDLVTLITCTPYGINTHRLCVEGERVPYTEERVEEGRDQQRQEEERQKILDWIWIPVSLILTAGMAVLLVRYNRE